MSRYAMLTAFGEDRPGIVAAFAEGLYHLGCNIEDACMTRLRGEFAMMVMVRAPEDVPVDHMVDRLTPYTSTLGLPFLDRIETLEYRPVPKKEGQRASELIRYGRGGAGSDCQT